MKIYTIGRDVNCSIPINDPTDVISRQHAQLRVESSGKMTITDLSRNGTYVNGMRIQPNTPTPVTRNDNVSFAHVARLDWSLVPKTLNPLFLYGGLALLVLILILGAILLFGRKKEPASAPAPTETNVTMPDSGKVENNQNVSAQPVSNGGGNMPAPVAEEKKDTPTTTPPPAPQPTEVAGTKSAPAPPSQPKCKTCGLSLNKCKFNGKHPKPQPKCKTCNQPLDKCKYKGKHPTPPPAPGNDDGGRGRATGGF